ncbi:MAG: hypothetical protein U1E73_04580 [Planctomycetota bacterium]
MTGEMRIVGRLDDLRRRRRRAGERRLCDDVARWSLRANGRWLDAAAAGGAPFLQVSAAPPGTVLAWELARLGANGYLRFGPLWVPRRWLTDADAYRRTVVAAFTHVARAAAGGSGADEFAPKAAAELRPLLRLWPHVLAVPTASALSSIDLIRLRAWPVHPLGIVARPQWADGGSRSPLEFFCHDLDHARYKVREDLLARGIAIPDAYVDGGTLDAVTGRHRTFLAAARPHVDGQGWRTGPARAALADACLRGSRRLSDRALGVAVRWLLFELLHEKSLPLAPEVLARELAHDGHVQKLAAKATRGFYGAATPTPAVVARLPIARAWLRWWLGGGP